MVGQLSFDAGINLDARIEEVLMGRSGPWPLPPLHHNVLRLLQPRKGAARAKPLGEITVALKIEAREVKAAVKSLVEDFGVPIGASRQEPYGYFLCLTQDDVAAALRPLINELVSIARRVRALGGQQVVEELFGQLPLGIEKL